MSSAAQSLSKIESNGRLYLAGPFTAMTRPLDGNGEAAGGLQVIDGVSAWRSALVAAEVALRRLGWSVFLPHRDVSAWGMRRITPEVVARECLDALLRSDLVVALLGESFGTHVEVGAALGRGIPTVIVRTAEFPESYFGGGVAGSALTGEIVIRGVADFAASLGGPDFSAAIAEARHAAASRVP